MNSRHRRPAFRLAALLTLALLALAGCGQKGPLYMPNDSESAKAYDPQGAHEDEAGTNARSDDEPSADTGDAAQSSPAPSTQQPNAEELP